MGGDVAAVRLGFVLGFGAAAGRTMRVASAMARTRARDSAVGGGKEREWSAPAAARVEDSAEREKMEAIGSLACYHGIGSTISPGLTD